jgi:hypothetical protein
VTAAVLFLALAGPALGQEPLQGLLDQAFGPGQAYVFVRTVEAPGAGEQEPPPPEEPGVLWDEIRRRMDAAPSVLPGYNAPSDLKREVLRSLQQRAGPGPSKARGERLHVTLVLDSSLDARTAEKARSLVFDAAGLDPGRGDTLRAVRAMLQAETAADAVPRQRVPPSPLPTRRALTAILALAAGAMLLLAAAALLRVLRVHRPRPEQKPSPPPAPVRIGPGRARAVAEFLAGEGAGTAAEVLLLAEPRVAADIFRHLPSSLKRGIAECLLAGKEGEAAQCGDASASPVRERLRSRLDSYDRGEGFLIEMLLRCSQSERDEVLAGLPAAYRLKEELLSLCDLAASDDASLRTCLAAFSSEELALCLYELPEPTRERILGALPGMFRAMVSEKLGYMVPDSLAAVAMAQGDVCSRWRRLELCGRVRPLKAFEIKQ